MGNNELVVKVFDKESIRPKYYQALRRHFRCRGFSESIIAGLIAISDSMLVFLSGLLLYLFYLGWGRADYSQYFVVSLATSVIIPLVFYFVHLYSLNRLLAIKHMISKILIVCSIIFLGLIATIFAAKSSTDFSRVWIFSWFGVSTCLILIERFTYLLILKKWSKSGWLTRNIAIFGTEKQAARLVEMLNEYAEPWIRIVGIFDDRASRIPDAIGKYPLLGNMDSLTNYVRNNRLDDVLVALPGMAEHRILEIVNKLNVLPVRVRLCPDLTSFNFLNHKFSFYGGVPVLNINNKTIEGWDWGAKAFEDRFIGLIMFVLLLPLMLIVGILIKLDSPGPVFFLQERYGFNNRMIKVLKFRTMYADKQDSYAEKLVTRNDSRVTRIGAILRRTSIDELPQIINVLKGEMSIVGPRPHATKAKAGERYYSDIVAEYAVRHKVKPGMTGWAQVNGWRGETDTEEKIIKRVEFDLDYIKRCSFLFDMRIILKTIMVVLFSKNAY